MAKKNWTYLSSSTFSATRNKDMCQLFTFSAVLKKKEKNIYLFLTMMDAYIVYIYIYIWFTKKNVHIKTYIN